MIFLTNLQCRHWLLCEFAQEFKELYYQHYADWIHFVQQSIHILTHLALKTVRVSPLSCYSQWTIKTAIGNLGDEICQDRDPYAIIAQRGVLCAQLNSILVMFPHFDLLNNDSSSLPCGARDLGQGFVLLCMGQNVAKLVTDVKARAILHYWEEQAWSHLQLPNEQRARSRWYESHSTRPLRKKTCVKVCILHFFSSFKYNLIH